MTPKEVFDSTMQRVDGLLKLYDLLCNRRRRKTRRDWAGRFKKFMYWPAAEQIHRINGGGALLVLRASSKLTTDTFCENGLSELLRAGLVMSISALDRYCHELLLILTMRSIQHTSKNWSGEFSKLALPLPILKDAITHARLRSGAGGKIITRPMNIVRSGLQDLFHRDFTLQKADEIAQALSMVGIKNLWTTCATHIGETPDTIKRRLNGIVKRRNQIAHEGDIVKRRRGGKIALNSISRRTLQKDVTWLRSLVDSINRAAT